MSEDVQILSSPDGLSLPLELDSEPSGPPTSTHPTPSPSPPPSVNVIRISPMKRPHNDSRLFVDVPLLSPEDKAEYRDAGATLDDVALGTIEAVVGEYEEDGELYYYARFSDGVIHKVRPPYIYVDTFLKPLSTYIISLYPVNSNESSQNSLSHTVSATDCVNANSVSTFRNNWFQNTSEIMAPCHRSIPPSVTFTPLPVSGSF